MIKEKKLEASDVVHIQSVQHLKTVVRDLEQQQTAAQQQQGQGHVNHQADEDERHLVHYFNTFFDDLQVVTASLY